ncbi:MAG TPA: DUF4286 family protein [Ferruginibacter sp.]|jgi:hypothetical protein|nr:DUF4286 family protein [Ferruginibacter sp.]HPH92094.1 DUF4286 family protein [Ferruginibacter sp.]
MTIYNVTIKLDESIHEAWLEWLQQVHIPEVIATGCFTKATILRLVEVDDSEGPTYAVQYHAESKALYNTYIENHAPEMRQRSFDKWGNRFVAFRSVMQVVG